MKMYVLTIMRRKIRSTVMVAGLNLFEAVRWWREDNPSALVIKGELFG